MPKFLKGSPEAKAHMDQLRAARNYKKMKGHEQLIMTGTAKIGVPLKMLYINPQGDQKIINTLTKKGNLTSREKKPVIKLVNQQKDYNYVSTMHIGISKLDLTKKIKDAKWHDKRDNPVYYDADLNYWKILDHYKKLLAIINKKSKLTEKNKSDLKYFKTRIISLSPDTITGLKSRFLYSDTGISRDKYKKELDDTRSIYDEVIKMN